MSFMDRFRPKQEAVNDIEPTIESHERVDGDRGIPSVNTKRRTSLLARILQAVLILFGLALITVSVWTLYKKYGAPADSGGVIVPKEPNQIKNTQPIDFGKAQPLPASEPAGVMKQPAAATQPAQPVQVANGQRLQPITPAQRKLNAGMKFGDGSGSDDIATSAGQSTSGGNGSLLGGGQSNNGLSQMLTSTKTPMAVATLLPDPDFLLAKGTVIDCIAQAAINTTQPGMFDCFGSSDVWSKSNRVRLLERGTIYHIEYQRGITQGQDRIFLLASGLVTPWNVEVALDAPITDALGRAGLGGTINTHFFDRFGGSIMLGFIGDFGQAVANRSSESGSQFSVQNTTRAGTDAASKALEATVNIPATLEHNHGAHVKLYVPRHVDFRRVYDLTTQR